MQWNVSLHHYNPKLIHHNKWTLGNMVELQRWHNKCWNFLMGAIRLVDNITNTCMGSR